MKKVLALSILLLSVGLSTFSNGQESTVKQTGKASLRKNAESAPQQAMLKLERALNRVEKLQKAGRLTPAEERELDRILAKRLRGESRPENALNRRPGPPQSFDPRRPASPSPEQRQAAQRIRAEMVNRTTQINQQLRQSRLEMREITAAPKFDEKKVRAIARRIGELEADQVLAMARARQELQRILPPERRGQLPGPWIDQPRRPDWPVDQEMLQPDGARPQRYAPPTRPRKNELPPRPETKPYRRSFDQESSNPLPPSGPLPAPQQNPPPLPTF